MLGKIHIKLSQHDRELSIFSVHLHELTKLNKDSRWKAMATLFLHPAYFAISAT